MLTEITERSFFHGIEIIPANHYVEDCRNLLCIAVHESIVDEIEKKLKMLGVKRTVRVAPFITELSLASSFVEERMVNTYALQNNITEHLGIAIRYAAIDQFYKRNQKGFDIYKKGIAAFSSKETAESRLRWFISLMKSVDQKGYLQLPICIDKNNEIIDGEHRFTLAVYHHIDRIACKVFNSVNYHKPEVYLTEEVLRRQGFTDDDIAFLDKTTTKMLVQLNISVH